jgi:hypothetical protein
MEDTSGNMSLPTTGFVIPENVRVSGSKERSAQGSKSPASPSDGPTDGEEKRDRRSVENPAWDVDADVGIAFGMLITNALRFEFQVVVGREDVET